MLTIIQTILDTVLVVISLGRIYITPSIRKLYIKHYFKPINIFAYGFISTLCVWCCELLFFQSTFADNVKVTACVGICILTVALTDWLQKTQKRIVDSDYLANTRFIRKLEWVAWIFCICCLIWHYYYQSRAVAPSLHIDSILNHKLSIPLILGMTMICINGVTTLLYALNEAKDLAYAEQLLVIFSDKNSEHHYGELSNDIVMIKDLIRQYYYRSELPDKAIAGDLYDRTRLIMKAIRDK